MLWHKLQGAGGTLGGGVNPFGFVAASTSNTQVSNTSLSIDFPSGSLEGDLCVLVVGIDNTDDHITLPSGWTQIYRRDGSGSQINYLSCYKTLQAADISSGTLTLTTSTLSDNGFSDGAAAVMANFGDGSYNGSTNRGIDSGAVAWNGGAFNSGYISVLVYYLDDDDSTSGTVTGWTKAADAYRDTDLSSGGDGTAGIFYKNITSSGSYTPPSLSSGFDLYASSHIRLIPN